jgi:acyl-CoA dehydrogenase
MELEAAHLMAKAAPGCTTSPALRRRGQRRQVHGAEAGFNACQRAMATHGGFGYAKEYHVERYLREMLIPRVAPVSPQLILCFIAEKVLGLPKSY